MAMKMLSSRLLPSNLPTRVCVTSSASMSSSSTPSAPSSQNKVANPVKKRESLRSKLASIFGGYVDPANPNDPPIPSEKVNFADITDKATGESKLMLLAFENGYLDPYCNLPVERKGRGTKDNPIKVESFVNDRTVACICESSQNYVRYTHVYRGEPKRCQCGHWLELVDAPKFWLDIPKEDLIEIPFFRDLHDEGKLDKFLSGEMDHEEKHAHGH